MLWHNRMDEQARVGGPGAGVQGAGNILPLGNSPRSFVRFSTSGPHAPASCASYRPRKARRRAAMRAPAGVLYWAPAVALLLMVPPAGCLSTGEFERENTRMGRKHV